MNIDTTEMDDGPGKSGTRATGTREPGTRATGTRANGTREPGTAATPAARAGAGPRGASIMDNAPGRPSPGPQDPRDRQIEELDITAWIDPLVDALGHDPRSAYVETYWLGVLGPSTTLLMRRLASNFDKHPDGFTINLPETARCLGLGASIGRHSPLMRSIARCEMFKLAVRTSLGSVAVRRRLPPLARRNLLRLPASLQQQHRLLVDREPSSYDPATMRSRARQLALGLVETGNSATSTEDQLARWALPPDLASEATRWAVSHTARRACH